MKKRIFAQFDLAKSEKQDDGTLKVWGYASTDQPDDDGETITAAAMKAALPDYMKWGAVREMHGNSAAGTAIEAEVQDDGKTWFGAHIVDPVAVTKVETGVYKGFSIGGRVPKGGRDPLNKAQINTLELIEVSLVDRPCNPGAVFTMYKAALSADQAVDELASLLDDGEITPLEVVELVRKHLDGNTEPAAPEPAADAPADDLLDLVKKGMYSVGRFAELLQSLAYLTDDTQYEATYEADNSPLPAALRKWMKDGIAIFKAMAEEEATELLASLQATSKAAGAKPGVDLVNKAATVEDSPAQDASVAEAIAKALAPISDELAKLKKENVDLAAKVQDMSTRAAPGKALLKALTITKATDVAPPETQVTEDETPPEEGTLERAHYEMRKALSLGVRLAN